MDIAFIRQLIDLINKDNYIIDLLAPLERNISSSPSDATTSDIETSIDTQTEAIGQQEENNIAIENGEQLLNAEDFEEYLSQDTFDYDTLINLSVNFSLSVEEIFKLINASILHGEYFTILEIDTLKIELSAASSQLITELKNRLVNYETYYVPLGIYFRVIERGVKDYCDLITSLKNKVESNKKVYYTVNADINSLIDEAKQIKESGQGNAYYELENSCLAQYKLFRINSVASKIEFLMQSSDFERLLSDLLIDIKWIDEFMNDLSLADAIKAKCQFIWSKIRYRIEYESEDEITFSDGVTEIPLINEENPFKDWIETIVRHYELSEDSLKDTIRIVTRDRNLNSKPVEQIVSLAELHLLIKYYKDCTDNDYQDNLSKIRAHISTKYFEQRSDSKSNVFDIYAYGFALNYAINNEFSSLLSNKKASHEKIKELYIEVCKVQEQTAIDNFFPQGRYLEYLIEKIKLKLKEDIKSHNLNDIIELLKEARTICNKYDKNIYWAQNTYNYVFYLPQSECSENFTDRKEIISKIFIASSFNLPLYSEKYLRDYNQSGLELTNLERSVEVLALINDEQKEIKERSEQLADDLRGKETKYIEILGIFGAVITFASAAFTTQLGLIKDANRHEILTGMGSIGVILFLFIALLMFVTRIPLEKMWKKTQRYELRKFGIACAIAFISILITGSISYLYINWSLKNVPSSNDTKNHAQQLKDLTIRLNNAEERIKKRDTILKRHSNLTIVK